MITKDIYGKTFSNYFNSAIASYAQMVKPKITINLLDSRHITLTGNTITTNSDFANTANGALGFYFNKKQVINGYERQALTWAVTDIKEKDGTIIKADGRWHCMPETLDNEYEYGWWSNTKSLSNGSFTTSPTITMEFATRKINKIKVVTSEFYGQVKEFRIQVFGASPGYVQLFDSGTVEIGKEEYFKEFYIKSNNAINANYNAGKIELTVISTKNPLDYARIQEIVPIYELDITDSVIDYSISRTRDVHESSLPIGGSESPKLSIRIDNTDKEWNILDSNSSYGQYMVKELKVNVATGWRIKKTTASLLTGKLKANMSSSANTFSVYDNSFLPDGGNGNKYIVIVDPDNENREIILCNTKSGSEVVNIQERAFGGGQAKNHSAAAVVQFDPYEYVPMGDFYIDEWSLSSDDMVVTISASDWTKKLSEKKFDQGFILENKTVGEAVQNIVLKNNFPKADFRQLLPYAYDVVNYNPVLHYSFNEDVIGTTTLPSPVSGLRMRFWAMKSGKESEYKNIVADIQESQISVEKRYKSPSAFESPDKIEISTDVNANAALDITNYTFTSNRTSAVVTEYFNSVIDGYYIPQESGNQDLVLDVTRCGFRMYLDDLLIAEDTRDLASTRSVSSYTWRGNSFLNLEAGVPYRLRIELFHGSGSGFSVALYKNNSSLNNKTLVTASEVRNIVAIDNIGSRKSTNTVPVSYDKYTMSEIHSRNDAFIHSNVVLNKIGGITSQENNKAISVVNGGYVRIPKHESINISEKDFTIELFIRLIDESPFSGDGEYISSWANSNPSNGFEFFHSNSPAHGFKIKTTSGTESVVVNEDINNNWQHIIVTYNTSSKLLSYYQNGALANSITLSGNIVTQNFDTTIGGRGAYYQSGTGEVGPSNVREFEIDEYTIYSKTLSAEDVANRYASASIDGITVFPYLYGEDMTAREAVDALTLADLGRFYIDENNLARYEHANRFFESSISQHANVQYTISDSSNIISGDLNVQLQTNKVTVKVNSNATSETGRQRLWIAEDPTTLAVVKLVGAMSNSDTTMLVSTTTDPVFAEKGYLAIDNEIIKYSSKTTDEFLELERGQFGTVAASHEVDSKVREARYYEITYDKKPAVNVQFPFVSAIIDEEPDLINVLKFEHGPYMAKLIIAASANNDYGSIVYAQGRHKLTEVDYFTSIAGTPVAVTATGEKITEQVASLSENIKKYGLKELTIDSPYIVNKEHAEKMAKFIIDKVSNPVPIVNISIMSIPTIQLGDRIKINEFDALGIESPGKDYWVISQEFAYGETISHLLVLRQVV